MEYIRRERRRRGGGDRRRSGESGMRGRMSRRRWKRGRDE
jgi:hypothetical protein